MPLAPLPGLRLHYLQLSEHAPHQESRPNLVMIHGLAANAAFWYAGGAPAFTRLGRVILYDLRGHGLSEMPASGYSAAKMAEDLGLLLDYLDVDDVHLVAHSFGGSIAIHFALAHPSRVKSLILADVRLHPVQRQLTFASWPTWSRLRKRLAAAGVQLDEGDPEAGLHILTELARLRVSNPVKAKRLHQIVLGAPAGFGGVRGARRWLKLLETTSAYAEFTAAPEFRPSDLSLLRQPILAVFGEHSMAMASARAISRQCAQARLEIVPRAGHFFPLSRKKAFVQASVRFLTAEAGLIRESTTRTRSGRNASAFS